MVREFFRSMELFYEKHHRKRSSTLRTSLTVLGMRTWMGLVLVRNRLAAEPKVRP
jgi:hypothetical protein